MGLLDDAIREHLELMRLRGADPAEVARAETDVFGPDEEPEVTAEDVGIIPATPVVEPVLADEVAEVVEPVASPEEFAAAPEPAIAPDEPVVVDLVDEPEIPSAVSLEADPEQGTVAFSSEDVAAAMEATPLSEADGVDEEPVVEIPLEVAEVEPVEVDVVEPEPEYEPVPEPEPEPAVYERDPEPAAEAEATPVADVPEGEVEADVLDETPEFLQETPEHDRLWFEQAPPRDFDF